MNIVLLGGPGAGKGTQAVCLSKEYGLSHVSTGEYFRKIMAAKTELGRIADSYIAKGLLVPDEIVVNIAADRLKLPDCRNGFILDGFPRTIFQATELKKMHKIDLCINIDIDPDKLLARILGRRVCKECGKNYHAELHSSEFCSACGAELIRRADDTEQTVKERIRVYKQTTMPLIDFYKNEGILHTANGAQTIDKVFSEVKAIVDKFITQGDGGIAWQITE